MSQFIIEAGTKQYMVEPGKKLNVDRINDAAVDSIVELPCLFSFDDKAPKTSPSRLGSRHGNRRWARISL